MRHRELLVAGWALVALMHVVFLSGGFDRGPLYVAFQLLGVGAALGAALALRRTPAAGFAAALALLALSRLLQVALGLSRLPTALNLGLFGAYMAGAIFAAWWATSPPRAASATRGLRASLWLLAGLHFVSSVVALGGGRATGIVGLACGTVGYSLLAPNAEA